VTPRRSIIAGEAIIVIRARDTVDSVFSSIRTKANKLAYSLGNIGQSLSLGGLIGTAGLIGVVKQFTSFEDSILFLRTNLEDTEVKVEKLIAKIRELGRTTSFTAKEVAEGAVVLGQAGFSSQEIEDSLQSVLDLARASRVEFETAGRILANLVRTFEIPTENASLVADQLVVGARKGTLGLIDLGESLKEVSGTARSLDIDLPTIINLITQLSFASLRGTKAGTSLNTALLQIAGKADSIRNLGVNLPEQVNSESILQFFQDLSDRLERVSNLSRTAILQQLFNIRGARAANALFLRLKELPKLEKQLRAVNGEARRTAEIMDSKLGGAFRIAKSAVEDFGITIGLVVEGPITSLLKLVPPLTTALGELAKANPAVVLALAAIPPVALAAGLGLIGLSFGLTRLGGIIGVIRPLVTSVGKGIGTLLGSAMIGASRASNVLFGSLSKVDKKLSSIFLTPQLKGGRGRNARKIVPTSFFGRIGNKDLTKPLTIGATKLANVLEKLIPTSAGVGKAITKTATSISKIAKVLSKTTGITKAYISLISSLSSVFLVNLAPSLGFIPRSAGVLITAIKNIITQIKVLGKLQSNALLGFRLNILKAAKSFSFFNTAILITGKFANVINTLTSKLNGLSKVKFASLTFLTTTIQILQKSLLSLAKGNIGAAFDIKKFNTISQLFTNSNLGKGASGLISLFGNISKGALSVLKITPKVFGGAISGLAKGGTGAIRIVGGLIRGFGSLLAVSFRTLTTLSGWGNILTILLLIGPEIKFIREAFARLGTGLGETFSILGSIFTDAAGPLKLFSQGITDLIQGKTKTGFAAIRVAFIGIADIISGRLQQAWGRFVLTIAPALNFVKNAFGVILETVTLITKSVGSLIGAVAKSTGIEFDIVLGGAASNLDTAFSGAIAFIETSASLITDGIALMVETIVGTMGLLRQGFGSIVKDYGQFTKSSFARTFGLGKPEAEADALSATGEAIKNAGIAQLLFSEQIPGFFKGAKIEAGKAFEIFKTNLTNLFSNDVAPGAQANIDAGFSFAQAAIDRIANLLNLRESSNGNILQKMGLFFGTGGITTAIIDGIKAGLNFKLPEQQKPLTLSEIFKAALAQARANPRGVAEAQRQISRDRIQQIGNELRETDLETLRARRDEVTATWDETTKAQLEVGETIDNPDLWGDKTRKNIIKRQIDQISLMDQIINLSDIEGLDKNRPKIDAVYGGLLDNFLDKTTNVFGEDKFSISAPKISEILANPINSIVEGLKQVGTLDGLLAEEKTFKRDNPLLEARLRLIRERQSLLNENKKLGKIRTPFSQVNIRDILGSVVGDIRSSRANNVMALNDRSDNALLENIVTNTGGTKASIDVLAGRVGPLVLQP